MRLSRARLHAGDPAREGLGRGRRPAPQDGLLASQAVQLPAELDEQYVRWRDTVCNRRIHATGRFPVFERLAHEREVLRPLPPTAFDYAGERPVRVPLDGYLKLGGSFYRTPLALVHQRVELRFNRDQVWIRHAGETVASYPRSYEQGCWFPPPAMRPEPPAAASVARLVVPSIAPPELADYAELSA